MKNNFKREQDIEEILKMIEKNPAILAEMNVNQLEIVQNYIKNYENHLKNKEDK